MVVAYNLPVDDSGRCSHLLHLADMPIYVQEYIPTFSCNQGSQEGSHGRQMYENVLAGRNDTSRGMQYRPYGY